MLFFILYYFTFFISYHLIEYIILYYIILYYIILYYLIFYHTISYHIKCYIYIYQMILNIYIYIKAFMESQSKTIFDDGTFGNQILGESPCVVQPPFGGLNHIWKSPCLKVNVLLFTVSQLMDDDNLQISPIYNIIWWLLISPLVSP